ncbi:BamA/TamA family outer membrane protein [Luteolibacter arcticus]|uniref:BamA/TamA family outer membrane protein n=1 Tax=Luteolibacter arcticus TaxID=1581411 RepID=A0ABT3GNV8_9BACT|nr:ShlB/FhaC/HecB family hemolysin secretion/activation protein [Luteolibacter arcticus]MCW1925193.1 BamA/TamA family outer membrane protein [Luteolibacter arcticus]
MILPRPSFAGFVPLGRLVLAGIPLALAMAMLGQEPDSPEVVPAGEGVAEPVLPPPGSLDFLAQPVDPPSAPSVSLVPKEAYVLPPVDEYLPARATVVPLVRVDRVRFEGNTAIADRELAAEVAPFMGGELSPEDLDRLCHGLTSLHVDRGYINSGATVPDRAAPDGTLTVQITEGKVTDLIVEGNHSLSDGYLAMKMIGSGGVPLHFPTLQRQLQVLQENPNIARINAELKPGLAPGEALMVMDLEELPRWGYGMDFHNQRSPSVGGEQAEVWFEDRSLTGFSDNLRVRLGLFSGEPEELDFAGLGNTSLYYQRPILADDTSLVIGGSREDYSILEEPFRGLAIDGESWTVTGGLRHPLYRSLNDEVWLSLLLEKSEDKTFVLGRPFTVSPGSVDGELDLTRLSLGAEWTRRTQSSVLAARTAVTAGIDALGATQQPSEPDSEFLLWSAGVQYSKRLSKRDDVLVVQAGFQMTNDALPPPAQFRMGGRYTVRGYRENYMVRDQGFFAGVEYQIPLRTGTAESNWSLWLAPFVDGGMGWDRKESDREALLSCGVGLRGTVSDWFEGELYFGLPLRNRSDQDSDLQDHGIHFRVGLARF